MSIFRNIKSIGLYSFVGLANGVFQFLLITYVARTLNMVQMGQLGLALTITYLAVPLVTFGSVDLIGLNVANFKVRDFIEFFNRLKSFFLVTSGISLLAISCFTVYFELGWISMVIIFYYSLIRAGIAISDQILILRKSIKKFAREKIRTSILTLLFGIFLVYFNGEWKSYLIAIAIAESISIYFRYRSYVHLITFNWDAITVRKTFWYGLPFVLNIGGAWILNQSDKLFVEHFFGIEVLAGYTLAFQLGMILRTFSNAISTSFIAELYREYKVNNVLRMQRHVLQVSIILGAFVLLMLAFFLQYGFTFVYGDKFLDYKPIVVIIFVAFIFESFYRIFDSYIVFRRMNYMKTGILYISALVGVVIMLLVPRSQGIIGPALGVLGAYIILFILSLCYSNLLRREI